MRRLYALTVVIALAVTACVTRVETETPKTVSDMVAKSNRPPGAPRHSDVCLSSRWRHPHNDQDPHDTFRDAAAFHATRLDWVYSFDPAWIRECRERGYSFGGALNTKLPDAPGQKTKEKGRVLSKAGEPVTAPWMKEWKAWWGCVNSPEYRRTYLAHARLLIDGGADSIHMDDPGLNATAVKWGGCHCEYCQERAQDQGVSLAQGMKAFQEASVREFYAYVREEIDRYAGRHVTFSSNNYDGGNGFPYNLFDYGIAELPERSGSAEVLHRKFSEASGEGRAQIFTFVSVDVPLTRRVIATAYACGGHVLVPYDVYHENHARIFANPENYADLYGFARANAVHLDGYEDAAVAGEGLKEGRYGKVLPLSLAAKGVYAFVRARPGEPKAPVVIHVVDWRVAPEPFVLKLRTACFFGDQAITGELLIPPPYDKEIHAKAEENDSFALLCEKQEVQVEAEGDYTLITVPSLGPWGMVVLAPEQP